MIRYIGLGFIPGIPARDISESELSELERSVWRVMQIANPGLKGRRLKAHLLESGQYVEEKAGRGPGEDKAVVPMSENKEG